MLALTYNKSLKQLQHLKPNFTNFKIGHPNFNSFRKCSFEKSKFQISNNNRENVIHQLFNDFLLKLFCYKYNLFIYWKINDDL